MKKLMKYAKYLQYLYLAASALILASAIWVLAVSAEITARVPVWIGLLLALAGLCEGAAGMIWRKGAAVGQSFSSRAGLKVVSGVMILCQGIFVGAVMWVLMSVMLIMCGLSMSVSCRRVLKQGMRNWLVVGPVSALELLLGVLCFLDPALLGFSTGVMLGIGLVCGAAVDVCVWYLGRRLNVCV